MKRRLAVLSVLALLVVAAIAISSALAATDGLSATGSGQFEFTSDAGVSGLPTFAFEAH